MPPPNQGRPRQSGGEAFFRAVLDGLDQFVVVFDAEGHTTWWNSAGPRLTGYSPEEFAALPFLDLVAVHDRDRAASAIERLTDRGTVTVELEVATRDGDHLPVEFRGSRFDPPGEEPMFVTVGYPIADRREHESKLDRLRQRTLELMGTETKAETARLAVDAAQTVIEAPLSGIHVPDAGGTRLSPVATADSVEDTFSEPPTYPRGAPEGSRAELAWRVFESGEPRYIDDMAECDDLEEESPAGSVILHPLGTHGLFIVSAPTADAFDETDKALVDILAGALRTALDRVEREARLRRQNDRLERFASLVSHDMRNPITTAKGYLELAREDGSPEHLDKVDESLDRMETLVEDLLELAREGEESLVMEPVDLACLVKESWAGVETGDATLRAETTATVTADESRLRQLLENLFRNAVEHGSTGSQTGADDAAEPCSDPITVTVGDTEDGFYVADDGPGIPAEERDRVLLAGYTTSENGTGLGLSIVAEVADDHGWSVTVDESAAGGARFEFGGVELA